MIPFDFRGVKLHLSEDGKTLYDPLAPGPEASAKDKLAYMRESPIWSEMTEELMDLMFQGLLDKTYLNGAMNALTTNNKDEKCPPTI